MTANWIIDRFEEEFALLENPETLEIKQLPRTKLPKDANEGDALTERNGALRLNRPETQSRAKRITERFNNLIKNDRPTPPPHTPPPPP
jgi:hypothetical protein